MKSGLSAAICLASLSFSRSAAQPRAITLTWKMASTVRSSKFVTWSGLPSNALLCTGHQACGAVGYIEHATQPKVPTCGTILVSRMALMRAGKTPAFIIAL